MGRSGKPRGLRLRTKVTAALLALALVPLGIMTVVLVRVNLARLERTAKEYRMAVAGDAVRAVRGVVDRARTELQSVGAALADPAADVEERVRVARAHLLGARFVDVAALYDREGAHVDTLTARQAVDHAERPAVLDPELRERLLGDGVAYLPVVRSPGGRALLPILVPLRQGDAPRLWGFLWTAVDLATLSRDISETSRRRFTGDRERITVIDDQLRVVVHADPARILESLEGRGMAAGLRPGAAPLRSVDADYAAQYDLDDEAWLGVLVPIPELRWGVIVEQPRAEAYAGVRTTWRTAATVGATFLGVALVVGLLLGRRIARPVVAVAAAAGKVAAGDFATRVDVRTRDEVGEMAGAFNAMAGALGEYRERVVEETRIRTNLSRYLSPDVVETIVQRKDELRLGGERREVTVIFADVVAFTPLAERFEPERIVGILNELFTFLTEIVFRHGGIIDKFLGDAVMAVFGAPYAHEDDAVRAARAAEEMMRWLEVGNARWRKELGTDLQLAIGMNTGLAVAGNIGSQKRMEYTVIGDAVNVAARLETIARPGQILMTRDTMERISGEFRATFLTSMQLKGRQGPTEVYALTE